MIEPDTPGSPDRPVTYDGLAGLSWMSYSELAWMIERLPTHGRYLEVGSASGVSAARIADARPGLEITCVDNYEDADEPHVAEAEPHRLANWWANRRPSMRLWVGDFTDFDSLGPKRRFDAVLVDAGHLEEEAYRDLCIASRLLVAGGVLYCHDVDEPGWPGVTRAVERFQRERGWVTLGQHWTLRAMGKA